MNELVFKGGREWTWHDGGPWAWVAWRTTHHLVVDEHDYALLGKGREIWQVALLIRKAEASHARAEGMKVRT